MSNNFLANFFDWLGEVFEKFNPSAYRFLGATLPYLTPLPVAWLTAHSAEKFLNFTPTIAFIFVFVLEGIGLWFTSLLVDGVVDWIRSRNWKTGAIVVVLGLAVLAYIYLLVSLNVLLEDNSNPVRSQVITLLCFLPLISGIGNGYYKLKLKSETASENDKRYEQDKEERIRKEKNDLKLAGKLIKAGIDPRHQVHQYQSNLPVVEASQPKGDWRLLTPEQRENLRYQSAKEIMGMYNIGESTAFAWKAKSEK